MTGPMGAWANRIAEDLEAAADTDSPVEQLVDHLLAALADAGGALPSEELVRVGAQALPRTGDVAARLASDACERLVRQPDDGRKSPLAKASAIGGTHVTWLTSTGWTAAGHSSKRERRPAPTSMTHRLAIINIERWLMSNLIPALDEHDITTTVTTGTPLRQLQLQRAQELQRSMYAIDDKTAAAPLTGGIYPDLLVTSNWNPELLDRRGQVWPQTWQEPHDEPLDLQVAWEVELHSKARSALTRKVRNHAASAESLPYPWWHAVVWVVRNRRTWRDIKRTIEHVHQRRFDLTPNYVVPAALVGAGDTHPDVPLHWPEAQHLGLLRSQP